MTRFAQEWARRTNPEMNRTYLEEKKRRANEA
jgi:hypothetical protein